MNKFARKSVQESLLVREHPGAFERQRRTRMKWALEKGNVKIRREIRRPL
jgi:hypothetical protein